MHLVKARCSSTLATKRLFAQCVPQRATRFASLERSCGSSSRGRSCPSPRRSGCTGCLQMGVLISFIIFLSESSRYPSDECWVNRGGNVQIAKRTEISLRFLDSASRNPSTSKIWVETIEFFPPSSKCCKTLAKLVRFRIYRHCYLEIYVHFVAFFEIYNIG